MHGRIFNMGGVTGRQVSAVVREGKSEGRTKRMILESAVMDPPPMCVCIYCT